MPTDTTRTPSGFDLQGHRGARALAPENTIPAFRTALDVGVTTLELDVVVAGDDTVVVSHEPWMNSTICRAPAGTRIREEREHNLYEMDYAEIARYDCGSLQHPDFPEQVPQPAPKPRLADVIAMAEAYVQDHDRPPVFYNVEIKSRADWEPRFQPGPELLAERVLSVVAAEGVAGRTLLQSFDPRVLEAVHAQHQTVRSALLVGAEAGAGLAAHRARLSFPPDVYSPNYRRIDADVVKAAHRRGLTIVPWTVNDAADMKWLYATGVDGLITDHPRRARAVLGLPNPGE
jgi:glycerophosphoryl diester phosphodiesterase